MGTSCAITVHHKGITFVRDQWCDGYPSGGAGQDLVTRIPSENGAYKVWLERTRAFYTREIERIKKLEEERGILDDWDYAPYRQRPDERPGPDPDFMYYYHIDLDTERFSVSVAQFPLWNIPRGDDGEEWIRYLDCDGSYKTVLRPDALKQNCYRVILEPQTVSEDGLAAYQAVANSIDMIDESAWMTPSANHPSLALSSAITRGLMMYHNGSIYAGPAERYRRDTRSFHTYAEILLRAASPAGFILSFANSKKKFYNYSPSSPSGDPTYTFYRYRGCIVSIVDDCSTPERLHAAIGLAIEHAREVGQDACTFIIFSIQHIAVAEVTGAISENLHVSHSNIQPFMEAFGYESLERSLSLIARYLRPHCIADSTNAIKYVLPEEGSKLPSYASLPLDVLHRIMELVDSKTYNTFSLVCRTLRKEFLEHPRVCDYRINAAETFEMEICNYLPRARLHGLRADGTATSLLVFYPVHRFHHDDDCKNRIKCRYNSCCPCPHLCIEKKCPKPLQLQAPLESKGIYRTDETRTDRQDGESLYWEYIWSWEEYMPGLVLMDPNSVCEVCARCFAVENL